MRSKDNNPSAFPQTTYERVGEIAVGKSEFGMDLRDYFAARALQGMLCDPSTMNAIQAAREPGQTIFQVTAFMAYGFADAMLDERVKP